MLKRFMVLSGVLFGVITPGLPGEDTHGVAVADTIAARQASLDMSAITLRSMNDAVKAGREAKTQGYPAAVLAKWARTLPRMFPVGTGMGETPNTQARPTIWQDRAGFDRAAANYVDATARLADLAAANDTPGFTKQLDKVSQACRLCHGSYKDGDQGAPRK